MKLEISVVQQDVLLMMNVFSSKTSIIWKNLQKTVEAFFIVDARQWLWKKADHEHNKRCGIKAMAIQVQWLLIEIITKAE